MLQEKMLYLLSSIEMIKALGLEDSVVNEAENYFKTNEELLFNLLIGSKTQQIDLFDEYVHSKKFNPKKALMLHLFRAYDYIKSFENIGIDPKIAYNTLSDILVHQIEYFQKHSKIGISKISYQWLSLIYEMKIFKLGSLQYETLNMKPFEWKDIEYNEDAFEHIPLGTPVLNIHIQSKTNISPNSVDNSIEQAKEFFKKYYPDKYTGIFTCDSWLLYKGNTHILSKNSNIIKFSSRFNIIGESHDPGMAIERIYGKRYRSLSDYPRKTTLQKNAIGKFKYFGVACGYFIHK